MSNPILSALSTQVEANIQAETAAVALINGFTDRLNAAVAAAVANGATEAELAPVQAEIDALKGSGDDLAAVVAANQ